jgi:hypothetical protein
MLPERYQGYNPCSSQSYPIRGETFAPSHHSRGHTIASSHHITVRGNKAAKVEASHYLPTPRSSLDSAKNLPSSDVHGPKAILSPRLTVDQNNPVSLKDVDDHATIGVPISLPTPRPSLDSSVKQPLSFDSVLSRLMPLLDGTAQINGERKVTVVGVSSDIVDKLRAKSEASELPGWKNLRYVGFSALVFGKCT